ncbi:hypothetical protein [Variovorax paradoxus]|uniref:hypothetical protein n=1 Tax=Variovorax paradoxus TaxID=34073 RepID=UPI0029C6DCFC|nr:hypothetical protein RZE77_32710 [Variovorax paradoxus]
MIAARGARRLAACALALAISVSVAAQEAALAACRIERNATLSSLGHSYVRGEFRVVYTLDGPHALPDARDLNGNGVPDKVEDVATQLVVGRRLFSEVMGMTHPLRQPRYARAASIDVFLLKMEKGNGLSYDEVMNYRLDSSEPAGHCATRIDLLNSHSNQNVTPLHELFHQYQYGYTMFKPRWLLEGTARWAEYALRSGEPPQQSLPATLPALQAQVFSQTYATSTLWNRLADILDPKGRLELPADLAQTRYVDGSLVIHGDQLHGTAFVKALFEALGPLDHDVAARNGWRVFGWKEGDQRSSMHDGEIFQRVIQVVRQQAERSRTPASVELETFLALETSLRQEGVVPGVVVKRNAQ